MMTKEQANQFKIGDKVFIKSSNYQVVDSKYNRHGEVLSTEHDYDNFYLKIKLRNGVFIEIYDIDKVLLASDKEGITKHYQDQIASLQKKIQTIEEELGVYINYDSVDDYINEELDNLVSESNTNKLDTFKKVKELIP